MNDKLPTGQMEIQAALHELRKEREPTRRGILLCAATMGEMLRFGWRKEDLDSLEILWWLVRDGNGELLPHTSVGRGSTQGAALLTKYSVPAPLVVGPVAEENEECGRKRGCGNTGIEPMTEEPKP